MIPKLEVVYGLKVNTEIYGKECVEFINKNDFVCGSIPSKEPTKLFLKIYKKMCSELGDEEMNKRTKHLIEVRSKK